MRQLIKSLRKQAEKDGYITCRGCGSAIEADSLECGACGWMNPLVKRGRY